MQFGAAQASGSSGQRASNDTSAVPAGQDGTEALAPLAQALDVNRPPSGLVHPMPGLPQAQEFSRAASGRPEALAAASPALPWPAVAPAVPPLPMSSAAPLHIEFAVPVAAAQFRDAFALQVSMLARDGVQHAVMHLNPADMGPISVQIALDGQQAQIHFGSDSAQTRLLVEAGLPALAAALREAGLTLSGGGVSQHAPEQRPGSNPASAEPGRTFAPASDDAPIVHSMRVATGRLDTYA